MADEPFIGLQSGPALDTPDRQELVGTLPSSVGDAMEWFGPTREAANSLERGAASVGAPANRPFRAPPTYTPPSDLITSEEAEQKYGITGRLGFKDYRQGISNAVAQNLYDRALEDLRRQDIARRAPSGFFGTAARLGASFLAEGLDPLNVASAFVPVVGEARYAKWLLEAGGAFERTAIRAGVGAAAGAAGSIPLIAMHYGIAQEEQADYSSVDALLDLAYGAGLGGVLHAGLGPLTERGMLAEHGERLRAAATEALGEEVAVPQPAPLADAVARAPLQVRESALRSAIAAVAEDRPVASGQLLGWDAWHGSPYHFEAFSDAAIGTGEGSQAFLRGHYVAEVPDVAKSYQEIGKFKGGYKGKGFEIEYQGKTIKPGDVDGWTEEALLYLKDMGSIDKARAEISNFWHDEGAAKIREALDQIESAGGATFTDAGNLYRVRVTADREKMLDWDKPLNKQSEYVTSALRTAFDKRYGEGFFDQFAETGSDVKDLRDNFDDLTPLELTRVLQDAGIQGVKYLDQDSRGIGEGTRNFVIFDPSHISIVEKNGEQISREMEEAIQRAGEPPLGNPGDPLPDPQDAAVQRAAEEASPKGGPRTSATGADAIKEQEELTNDIMELWGAVEKAGMLDEGEAAAIKEADVQIRLAEVKAESSVAAALCLGKA